MKKCLFSLSMVFWASYLTAVTLDFSTFLGGNGQDYGYDIDVSNNGDVFVIGRTTSIDFPIVSGSIDTSHNSVGNYDVFITNISPNGKELNYSTFLGGSSTDIGHGIVVDGNENALVTGNTQSNDFPTQNAYDNSFNGGNIDAFVAKLSSDGSALNYSTFLGGSGNDQGFGITVDVSGNAILTGFTGSNGFPTQSAFDNVKSGSFDIIVTKITADGSSLIYSTYLGGSNSDYGNGISIDGNGNPFLVGYTQSTDFPTQSAFDNSYNGFIDAFVTKIAVDGAALIYSTFLGGSFVNLGNGITVDINENAFVTGYTASANFPVQSGFSSFFNGGNVDAFVTKFTADGLSLNFSSYLGSSGDDIGSGITTDENGNSFLTGYTNSSNFPMENAFDSSYDGNNDLFITQFDSSGSNLGFSSFLGGIYNDNQEEFGNPAVYKNGSLYLTANVGSGFPTTNSAFSQSFGGTTYDAAVARFRFVTEGDLTPNLFLSPLFLNVAQNYVPQIQISNLDSEASSDTTTTTLKINFNDMEVFSSTKVVPSLSILSDTLISFNSFLPYRSGTYEVTVISNLKEDLDKSNDTLRTSIEVLGDVVINEFLPMGFSQFDPSFTEFLEVANTSLQSVDISGWTIENSIGQVITVPAGNIIQANEYFVLTKYSNLFNGGTLFDYAFDPTNFVLNDISDFIVLKNSFGRVVDSVSYSIAWNPIQGESFERENAKLDSNNPNSWCKGTAIYGTEGNKGSPGSESSCHIALPDCKLNFTSADFGNVDYLTDSITSVKLFSIGEGDLIIDSLKFIGTEFSTNLVPQTILSGDSLEFQIIYAPTIEGVIEDTLTIFTNDWNDFVCEIAIIGVGVDVIAPSKILDFGFADIWSVGAGGKLKWTATGNDSTFGIATNYEIRVSANEITETNFNFASLLPNIPTPSASGIMDSLSVTGLTGGVQYYFGIKVRDNAGNESPISTISTFGKARITSITDVQNDNGGNVRITFDANLNDYTVGTGLNTNQYAILRKLNPNFSPSAKSNNQIYETLPSGTWEVIGSVPAAGEQSYTTVVSTLADSNSTGTNEFEFLVRAISIVSPTYNSVSNVVSAYSIDNLPPTIPPNQNFTNNGNGTTTATWNAVFDSDLDFYTIWAEVSQDSFTLVTQVSPNGTGTQSETFNDVSGAISYAVGSVDINGNESLPFANRISSLEIEVVGNDVVLNWVGKQDASLYKIYRGTSLEFSNSAQIGTFTPNGSSPTFTDFGASQNADKYFYFVTWEN